MAVYNGEKYLRRAVESILGQTFQDFELNVVDDGSTDRSLSLLRSYSDPRINIFENVRNAGQVASLNTALNASNGRYIAVLDADDVALPTRFEKQAHWLDQHPEVGVLGSYAVTIDEHGSEVDVWDYSPTDDADIRWEALSHNPVIHSSMMMRKSVLDRIGGYRVGEFIKREFATDYDLLSRILQCAQAAVLPEVLVQYRINSQGLSNQNRAEQKSIVENIARRNMVSLLGVAISDTVWDALMRFWLNWAPMSVVEAKQVTALNEAMQSAFERQNPHANSARQRQARYMLWARRLFAQARRNPHLALACRFIMLGGALRMLLQARLRPAVAGLRPKSR